MVEINLLFYNSGLNLMSLGVGVGAGGMNLFACLDESCPIMRLRVRRKFQLHGGYVSSLEEIEVTRKKCHMGNNLI